MSQGKQVMRGPVMADLAGLEINDAETELLKHPWLGGIILFARNIDSPSQVAALTQSIRDLRPELIIAVDQEGGRVQRMQQGFATLPPMQRLGQHWLESSTDADRQQALDAIAEVGWLMASEVLACGIDLSFAPVLDVDHSFSTIIGDRAFSDKPGQVAQVAAAFIRGMNNAGMQAVGKHFPGHGSVREDSHLTTPVDDRELDAIIAKDIQPFAQLIEQNLLHGIMPAHVVYSRLDEKPAVFSAYWLKTVLAQRLGFKGVVFSDDLSMAGAASIGDFPQRARVALAAGCDMVLVCNNPEEAQCVLNALEQDNYPIEDRLGLFRAQRAGQHSLQEIQSSERYKACTDFLKSLQ